LIKTAASGAARFDHNPITRESLGLLVEEARTNLVSNSIDFSGFGLNGMTFAANVGVSPDGNTTASQFTETTANSQHRVGTFPSSGAFVTSASGGNHAMSIFVKRVSGTRNITIRTHNVPSAIYVGAVTFDFTNETVSGRDGATASVQKFANGWYRLSFVSNLEVSRQYYWNIWWGNSSTENADAVYTGDTSNVFQVWGLSAETGSFPTSYIPTSGSTVTRAADVATVSNTNSSIFPTSAFTIVNSPYGTASGSSTLKLVGPTIKRTAVYNGDLTQAQINALAGVNDNFWRWRVLGSSFALPNFTTDGSVTVDWGDGVVETLTTGVHTFTNGSGYHDIGFRLNSGTYFRPFINGNSTYGPRVIAVGPAPASMKLNADRVFTSCTALKSFDATVDVSGGTSFYYAWYDCPGLTSFPLINTAAGTDFRSAWNSCTGLTSFPLINTAAGTSFSYAWYGCSSLTSFPLINTAAGTSFFAAWQGCSSLTSFPLITTAAGTSFDYAWYGCSSLTSFPLITTAAGTNFYRAWQGCTSLTSFPLINTSSGTEFGGTWYNCPGLISFPLINTAAGTNFSQTWYGCTSLTSFPSLSFASATSFYQAWYGCTSLTTFPANRFDTTGTLAAGAFSFAFRTCALTAASIENILTSLVTNGRSNITLDLDGGTNAGASTWTANAVTAYNTLISRGWTITRNA
jgi:hypothetical protein